MPSILDGEGLGEGGDEEEGSRGATTALISTLMRPPAAKGPPDWTERVLSGFKRWVKTGRAAGGMWARNSGHVGATHGILRVLKQEGWVEAREGPLGEQEVGKAEALAALDGHRVALLAACEGTADEERVEALTAYLRAGRRRDGVGGGGEAVEEQECLSGEVSSVEGGLEEEGG